MAVQATDLHSKLERILCGVDSMRFDQANHQGLTAMNAMRVSQLEAQNAQMMGMVAAMQNQQLVHGMQAMQLAGPGAVLPMHMGIAEPKTKAEQGRQRCAMKWAAQQQQQQQAQLLRQALPQGAAGVVHHSQQAPAAQQEQLASTLAGSSGAAAAPEEDGGAVQIPGQGIYPSWQGWGGDMKTITSRGEL